MVGSFKVSRLYVLDRVWIPQHIRWAHAACITFSNKRGLYLGPNKKDLFITLTIKGDHFNELKVFPIIHVHVLYTYNFYSLWCVHDPLSQPADLLCYYRMWCYEGVHSVLLIESIRYSHSRCKPYYPDLTKQKSSF